MHTRATQFLLSLLLLLLPLAASANIPSPPLPDTPSIGFSALSFPACAAAPATFGDVMDSAAYDDVHGGVRVVVVVFSDDPERGYVGVVGRSNNGAIWILYEGELPLGLDYVTTNGDSVFWVIQRDGIKNSSTRMVEIGTLSDGWVSLSSGLGGGRASLRFLKDAAKGFWSRDAGEGMADISGFGPRYQDQTIRDHIQGALGREAIARLARWNARYPDQIHKLQDRRVIAGDAGSALIPEMGGEPRPDMSFYELEDHGRAVTAPALAVVAVGAAVRLGSGDRSPVVMSQHAKRRLAKQLGHIPRSAQPRHQGTYGKGTRWWQYNDSSGRTLVVVEHADGTVHVGIPKPQSTHLDGGPPKYYPIPGTGHVGE